MKIETFQTTTRVLVAGMAYVWLVRTLYLFLDLDACLDGGGVYDQLFHACSGSTFGDSYNLGARMPFLGWMLLLGCPALLILVADRAVIWGWRRLAKTPNPPLNTD